MAGRIEIDDVAPVVSGGRFPAKAVVGEVVPVRATVWREGHDAVAATLVVRYHGTAYPQLADGSAGTRQAAEPVPIEDVVSRRRRGSNRSCCRCRRAERPTCSTASSVPDSVGLWTFRVDGWGDPIATWRKNVTAKLDAGQSESRAVQRPAGRCAAAGARRHRRAPRSCAIPLHRRRGAAARSPATRSPARARRCQTRSTELLDAVSAARIGHPRRAIRRLGGPAAGPVQRVVRDVSAVHRRLGREGQPGARHLRHRRQGAAAHRQDGLRRGLPAADPPDRQGAPQGPQQHA